jgi:hypothetical protein
VFYYIFIMKLTTTNGGEGDRKDEGKQEAQEDVPTEVCVCMRVCFVVLESACMGREARDSPHTITHTHLPIATQASPLTQHGQPQALHKP